jgi:hypothetical protein
LEVGDAEQFPCLPQFLQANNEIMPWTMPQQLSYSPFWYMNYNSNMCTGSTVFEYVSIYPSQLTIKKS